MYRLILLMLVAPFFSSCFFSKDGNKAAVSQTIPTMDTLILESCPDRVELKRGAYLILKLPAIEGTGYIWQLKSSNYLQLLSSSEYEKAPTKTDDPGVVGAPTLQVLRFQALEPGQEAVELFYARTFGTKEVANTCKFKLTVL